MPRPKGKSASSMKNAGPKAEGVSPYFRDVFARRPKLLWTRSNKQLLKMWLKDHPEHEQVPGNVKAGLANIKSVLRSKAHAHDAMAGPAAPAMAAVAEAPLPTDAVDNVNAVDSGLEKLEIMIDECMNMARELGIKKVDDILRALRIARRQVVWKLGED